jgi:hypothetical protein
VAPLVLSLLAACGTSGGYVAPRATVVRPDRYTATDAIPYRTLTPEDFLASAPPAEVAAQAPVLGAWTCANVVPEAQPRIVLEPGDEPGTHVARLSTASFRAEMDRSCSWWNPKALGLPRNYILQHEQIHFGLTELAARRLSVEIGDLRVVVRSPQEAGPALQREYDRRVQRMSTELVRENTEFDRRTSGRHDPATQAGWWARVQQDLAQTARGRGGPK